MSTGSGINVGGIYADLDIRTGNLDRGLARARQALEAVDQEVQNLGRDFHAGAISIQDYNARMQALIQLHADLTSRMQSAYSATQTLNTGLEIINANAQTMTNSAGRLAHGIIQLGYVVDDLQYSFAATINNIGPLVNSFTGSAGLATAAQIGSVALYQLVQHWDEITGIFSEGIPTPALEGLKAIEAQIRAVEKAIEDIRTQGSFSDLGEKAGFEAKQAFVKALGGAAKEQKSIDSMQDASKEERERGSAFEDAIKEQGGTKVVQKTLEDVYAARANGEEGQSLGHDEIDAMLRKGGLVDSEGKAIGTLTEDPNTGWFGRRIQDVKGAVGQATPRQVNRDALSAAGEAMGVQFDADAIDKELAKGKATIEQILEDQLAKNKFLFDEESGEKLTPKALARRRLAQGKAGNKNAAEDVGGILDESMGDLANFEPSEFSKSYNENSPEAKKALADRNAEAKLNKRGDAAETKEDLEEAREADKVIADLDRSNADYKRAKERKRQEKERQAKQDEQKAEQQHRQNIKDSKEASPGIEQISQALASQAALGGITPDQARDQIAAYLRANGRTAGQAQQASGEIYAEAEHDVKEGVVKRMFGPQKEEKQKHAEQFDASELAAKFQSSVGGDETKKQTGLMEKMEKHLDDLARAGVIRLDFRNK